MATIKSADSRHAKGSALCEQLSFGILDDYTDQLIKMVESSTHGLSIADIRAFLDTYKATHACSSQVFKTHFQTCLSRREQEIFDPWRTAPFKRMLAMRIAVLFPPEGGLDANGRFLSRRMLPGLFLALEKMAGADPFLQGHATCMAALEQIKSRDGVIIWENLHTHPAALQAVDDLLMGLLSHFDNPMKRVVWMLTLVNNALADPGEFDFEGDANRDWQLDERGLILILRHLFHDLRARLADKARVQELSRRYGETQVRQLAALLHALQRAEV